MIFLNNAALRFLNLVFLFKLLCDNSVSAFHCELPNFPLLCLKLVRKKIERKKIQGDKRSGLLRKRKYLVPEALTTTAILKKKQF